MANLTVVVELFQFKWFVNKFMGVGQNWVGRKLGALAYKIEYYKCDDDDDDDSIYRLSGSPWSS